MYKRQVYKVTRQVEDNIVYDDERDLDKSTFTESLRITFKNNGKVSIKETLQDDATWSGEWEANGYDITVYANEDVYKRQIVRRPHSKLSPGGPIPHNHGKDRFEVIW